MKKFICLISILGLLIMGSFWVLADDSVCESTTNGGTIIMESWPGRDEG